MTRHVKVVASSIKDGDIRRLAKLHLEEDSPEWQCMKELSGIIESNHLTGRDVDPEYDDQGNMIEQTYFGSLSDKSLGTLFETLSTGLAIGQFEDPAPLDFIITVAELAAPLVREGPIVLTLAAIVTDC